MGTKLKFIHNILLADDNDLLLRQIKRLLESEFSRLNIVTASGGKRALGEVKTLSPRVFSLAVLDHKMPDLTGIEVAREILKESPKTQIIFLTGDDSRHTLLEAANLPIGGFIEKGQADLNQALIASA